MTILKERGLFEGPVDELARQSFAGMAHFAGTGPRGATCKGCKFWEGSCAKYKALTGHVGKAVPDVAQACKYFEARRPK